MRALLFLLAAAALTAPLTAQRRILIAYHSDSGNTRRLAEAIRDGATPVPGVAVSLVAADAVTNEQIRAADGIVVGAPVHWQNASAQAKTLLDRIGSALSGKDTRWGEGKLAGVFTTAGSPSNGADLARIQLIASLLSLRFVIVGGVNAEGFGTLGPQGSPVTPDSLKEARAFGAHLARTLLRFTPTPSSAGR